MTKAEKTAAVKALNKAAAECTKAITKLTKAEGRAGPMVVAALARIGVALEILGEPIEEPQEAEMVADEAEVESGDE